MGILLNKIRHYSITLELTKGFFIALLSAGFIYLNHWGFGAPLLYTILGVWTLYLLLGAEKLVWFIAGAFIGLFWFWWITLSLNHYGMAWAVPLVALVIAFIYGALFWLFAWMSEKLSSKSTFPSVFFKAFFLFIFSYIHPLGFDWFKPELMFVESYLGIQKWQFALVLLGCSLSIWKKQWGYLLLIILAYQPPLSENTLVAEMKQTQDIALITTHTSVEDKWNERLHPAQFQNIFNHIDQAIEAKKTLVILPESVFPLFLNRSQTLINRLQEKAKHISIVTGALYWDGKTPRNSTYIFTGNTITVANKVVLVPFGESNPLPDFLSHWVNSIFYDGAVDYKASSQVIDYVIDGVTYRNAICFEATSEKLYEGNPKNMIVLSNNGWFTPSTEPTLQKLLLQYYSKKYSTTIYHAVNSSASYVIQNGRYLDIKF